MQQQQQPGIPLTTACQITEKVLIMMKSWLEANKGALNGHEGRLDEAIKSSHHARLLLNVFLRDMMIREQQMRAKK